ncbi:MAG: hypothetical protein LBR33_04630 [Propionibacteriaceae bacterium]|jgi:hypothetical protein|nr:hypothetical protein [Propionibacteriaceae bacterium]
MGLLLLAGCGAASAAGDGAGEPTPSPETAEAVETVIPEAEPTVLPGKPTGEPTSTASWREVAATMDYEALNAPPEDGWPDPSVVDPACTLPPLSVIRGIADDGREWPNPPDWPDKVAEVYAFSRDYESNGGLAPAGRRFVVASEAHGEITLYGRAERGTMLSFPGGVVWTEEELAAGQRAADVAVRCLAGLG